MRGIFFRIIPVFCLWAFQPVCAQTGLIDLCPLPSDVNESSGLELGRNNSYWTHNDSGDKPWLYELDVEGHLKRKMMIAGVNAMDIEDIAMQDTSYVYVGDFGNNKNERKELLIYKIKQKDLYAVAPSVKPEIIKFSYPDQKLFPPDEAYRNFDCEAMFWFKGKLYLFTKNRGGSGYTKCYSIPDKPGKYKAKGIDSFLTGNWVTAADISPNQKKVALLCGPVVYIFSNFKGDQFFKGIMVKTVLHATQKEGIVFEHDKKLVISDEAKKKRPGNLYVLNIDDEKLFSPDLNKFCINPPPFDKQLHVMYTDTCNGKFKIEIRSLTDNRFMEKEELEVKPNFSKKYNMSTYNEGEYSITITQIGGSYLLKRLFTVKHVED